MIDNRTLVNFDDFSGGLVTNQSVIGITPKESPDCLNMYSEGKKAKKRLGISKLNTSTVGAGKKGNGIFNWVKSATEQLLVAAFDSTLYKMDSTGTAWDGTFDTIAANGTNGTAFGDSIVHFITYAGTLIFTTEARDTPQKMLVTDASHFNIEYSGVGTSPKAKYVQVWKEHVWFLNIATGGALTEDCSDISDWTDSDGATAASTQTTWLGQSAFRFLAGTAAGDAAQRYVDIGTLPDNYAIEVRTYFDYLGTIASGNYAEMIVYNGVVAFQVRWSDSQILVYDGTNWQQIGVNLVALDTWAIWKFVVSGGDASTATVTVLKDGVFVGDVHDISSANVTNDGRIDLFSYNIAGSANRADWYMDYLYINTTEAETNYWTDGDFSEWTNWYTPTRVTEPLLPSIPFVLFSCNDATASGSVYNNGISGNFGTLASAGGGVINTTSISSTGKLGRCFSLNSASSHHVSLSLTDVSTMRTDSTGSICFWANPDVVDGVWYAASTSVGTVNSIRISMDSATATLKIACTSANNPVLVARGTTTISASSWIHCAVVQNNSDVAMYVNSSLQTLVYTTSTDRTAWYDVSGGAGLTDAIFGCVRDTDGGYTGGADGRIDDCRVYRTALISDSIRAIYAEGNGTEGISPAFSGVETSVGTAGVATPCQFRIQAHSHFWLDDNAANTGVANNGHTGADGTSSVNTNLITVGTASSKVLSAVSLTSASTHNINIDGVATALATNSVGTICFWGRPVSATTSGVILGFSCASANNMMVVEHGSSDVIFRITDAGTDQLKITASASWDSTALVHYAIVQDGRYPVMYKNGMPATSVINTTTDRFAWLDDVPNLTKGRIGCVVNSVSVNSSFFSGWVDDVRIYEMPLTASDIYAIYNGSAGTQDLSPTYPSWKSTTGSSNSIQATYISDASATTNFSTIESANIGKIATVQYKSLIKFADTLSIPSDATIKSGVLHNYIISSAAGAGSGGTNEAIAYYEILKTWTLGSVTWNSRNGTDNWSTAGIPTDGTDAATAIFASTGQNIRTGSAWYCPAPLTSTGIAAVQAWVAGTRTNNGVLAISLNTATNSGFSMLTMNHSSSWDTQQQFPPFMEVTYTIPEQTGEVTAKIGDDVYKVSNSGTYAVVYQTVASPASIAGQQCVFGLWIKPDAGVTVKLHVDDGTDTYESTTYTGDGAWQYATLRFTPVSTASAIKAKLLMTSEGQMYIDHASIILDSSSILDDLSDRLQRTASGTLDDFEGVDSGTNDIITGGDIGLTGSAILEDTMYVFKKFSIHQATYTGSTPLINLKQIRSGVGTNSPRSIKNVVVPSKGEMILFLGTDRRLYMFDGFDVLDVSDKISKDNGISSVYMENINSQALDKVFGVVHDKQGWYELFVPIGNSTVPDYSIVFDYINSSFWPFSNRNHRAGCIADNGSGQRVVYVQGNTSGFSYLTNSTNSDDGSSINAYYITGKASSPTMLKKMDLILITTNSVNATPVFSWKMAYESSYIDTTLSANTNEHWLNPGRIDGLIQMKISDNSTSPAMELWQIVVLEKALGHGR